MNALENLLIIAGISLDIFAAMECQGSLVAKIDKKQLVKLCALIAAWQMAALFVGSYLSGLLYRNTITHNEKVTGFVIAAAIFFCLGVRLVAKAIKNDRIVEHCEQKLGTVTGDCGSYQHLYPADRYCIWLSGNKSSCHAPDDRRTYDRGCCDRYLYRISPWI